MSPKEWIGEIDWNSGGIRNTRNRVRIYYGEAVPTMVELLPETWWGKALRWLGRREYVEKMVRPFVEVQDADSIARIGERYMEVEGTNSWSEELARTIANAALRDLSFDPL